MSWLFETPMYRSIGGSAFHARFEEALQNRERQPEFDVAAIIAILSVGYAMGDHTLFRDVERKPWLSSLDPKGDAVEDPVPRHGYRIDSVTAVADELYARLKEEAAAACQGRRDVFLMLSGGLDSRIAAQVLADLWREDRIARPRCVTWGIDGTRDVVYASEIARRLGLEWIHAPLGPKDLLRNITDGFGLVAGMVSPVHLHRMDWFRAVPSGSLAIAASWGDSIGRAEFSGTHLIDLGDLAPRNYLGIVRRDREAEGNRRNAEAIAHLRSRSSQSEPHILHELEMQGIYMRNMIGQAMSLVSRFCTLYQLFTHPRVYQYMWSLHPLLRTDEIYRAILSTRLGDLASIPWARNNSTLDGRPASLMVDRKSFHRYAEWIAKDLRSEIADLCSEQWFAQTGIFDGRQIAKLKRYVFSGATVLGFRPYQNLAWLAALRKWADDALGVHGAGEPVPAADVAFSLLEMATGRNVTAVVKKLRVIKKVRHAWHALLLKKRREPTAG